MSAISRADGPISVPSGIVVRVWAFERSSVRVCGGFTAGGDRALYVSDDKAGFIYRISGP